MESGGSSGLRQGLRELPRPGKQLGDALHRVIGQPGDDVDEV
jgi:hypothetical protein